jgi:methionyl-tRNA formyltransferase
MGTPEFAVPCLRALLEGPDEVVAVVAQPDKPAGRGHKLQSPPTVQLARAHGIPTLQPTKVRGADFPVALEAFRPDLIVVVAYGRILTEAVLRVPPQGCINVHASLLPYYRGAGPIQWSILRGETVTGVTTMRMDVGMDTGDMLLRREVPIDRMNAGQLHDVLSVTGAALLRETLEGLKAGSITPIPQDHARATYAPLIKKEDGQIAWERPAVEIDWHVRGMTPWPGAFTFLAGKRIVVLEGTPLSAPSDAAPGTVVDRSAAGLLVSTGAGLYRIERLKPENSRAMDVEAFLNGHDVARGARFTAEHP